MIIGQPAWKNFKYWRKYSAEEDFYRRLCENRFFPFDDLGNGFYYLRVRSARFLSGFIMLTTVFIFTLTFLILVGFYPLPICVIILGYFISFESIYGSICVREIIISRLGGYILRLQSNKKVLCEQEIYNIYIRLQKKTDSVSEDHFHLIIGGYLLDDIRISRASKNEIAMRLLGRRLARNLGINYFDYDDVTVKHVLYHYRGYSRLKWKRADLANLFGLPKSTENEESKDE